MLLHRSAEATTRVLESVSIGEKNMAEQTEELTEQAFNG